MKKLDVMEWLLMQKFSTKNILKFWVVISIETHT